LGNRRGQPNRSAMEGPHHGGSALLITRAVPDLLLGNPAGAGRCRICEANPAEAGAGAGFHHKISHQ